MRFRKGFGIISHPLLPPPTRASSPPRWIYVALWPTNTYITDLPKVPNKVPVPRKWDKKQGPIVGVASSSSGGRVCVGEGRCTADAHAQLAVCGPFPRCRPLSFQVDGRRARPAIRCERGTRTGGRSGLHTRGCAAFPSVLAWNEKEAAETLPPLRTWDRLSLFSGGANDRAAGVAGDQRRGFLAIMFLPRH
jgi:hypothetical protein